MSEANHISSALIKTLFPLRQKEVNADGDHKRKRVPMSTKGELMTDLECIARVKALDDEKVDKKAGVLKRKREREERVASVKRCKALKIRNSKRKTTVTGGVVKKKKRVAKEETPSTDEEIVTEAFSSTEDQLEDYLGDLKAFERPAPMPPAVYPADLFVPCCKGSYYLRRVSLDSGLLAVVRITGDVDETLEVQVRHFRLV